MFGSFVNVLIYRIPQGISLGGRSFCPKCKSKIHWYDNVPLFSYLYLKGRCRNCKKNISFKYPLVELLGGIGFIAIYMKLGVGIESIYYAFLFFITLSLFFIDLEKKLLPDNLVYFGIIITFLYLIFGDNGFTTPLFVSLVTSNIILFLHLITKGKGMGLGDVKLVFLLSLTLTFFNSLLFLYLSFLTGAILGTILILLRKAKMGMQIAFGPFIIVSFWIIYFVGDYLITLFR